MSIVRWTGIPTRGTRGAPSVNGFYSAFEGLGSIEAPNFAEEGIDRRALLGLEHADRLFSVEKSGLQRITTATAGTWTQLSQAGTAFRSSTGATLTANEIAVVRAVTHFQSVQGGNNGIDEHTDFKIRIAWSDGSTFQLTGSPRRVVTGNISGGAHGNLDGFLATTGYVLGPRTGADVIDWFELQYDINPSVGADAATCGVNIMKTVFYGNIYKRVI